MDWLTALLVNADDTLFAIGVVLIVVGLVTGVWLVIGSKGNVTMGPDPEIPPVDPPRYALPAARPLPQVLEVVEETVATIDLTETVEFRPVDPLAATAELEVIDESTPLFNAIRRRPQPLDLETHTQGWAKDGLLERIREGMKP